MKMNELKSATKPATRRLLEELEQHRGFVDRHIGTSESDQREMLKTLGYPSRAALIDAVVPPSIRSREPLPLFGSVRRACRRCGVREPLQWTH